MKRYYTYLVISITAAVMAVILAVLPLRYSSFDDGIVCGQESSQQYHVTVAGYLLRSRPIGDQPLNIGTCPYEHYYARTYAVELWLLAAGMGYMAYRARRVVRHESS